MASAISTKIRVDETFQQTIQGEGYWSGTPCDFIRLYGCPVGCSFCDTGYARGAPKKPFTEKSIEELISELKSARVVISGGEPLTHPHFTELCEALLADGRGVSVETSGVSSSVILPGVWVTLSPKTHVRDSRAQVAPSLWQRANEIKIVVIDSSSLDFYKEELKKTKTRKLYLQPEWEANTLPIVLEILKENQDWRISLQTHKYMGVQ